MLISQNGRSLIIQSWRDCQSKKKLLRLFLPPPFLSFLSAAAEPSFIMEFHAEFTENTQATKATPCQRPSCDVIIEPGKDRFYIHNKERPDQPGRYVCTQCFRHYRGLPTTERRRRQSQTTSQNGATEIRSGLDINNIRRDVNESQRQGAVVQTLRALAFFN